ncbi:MAG: hypothetical protein Q8R15_02240 [Candidatus Micrarchaeota archaeon]|nr:hypothetical protein [Candidatus Micrarchaeota archaeon]
MLFDFAAQISPVLDVLIVILAIALVYLLATRFFFTTPESQEQNETVEIIHEEKENEAHELEVENQKLKQEIKNAKQNYAKRKINATKYKQTIHYAQEQITENQARMRLLQQ